MEFASRIQNKTEGKRVCGGLWSKHAYGQQERPENSAEFETASVSQNTTTVVTANGDVLTKDEATVYVRELDLFVTVILVADTGKSFTRKTLRRSRVQPPLDLSSETHLMKMVRKSIATRRTTYHSLSLVHRQALEADPTYISYIFIAGSRNSPRSIPHQQEVRV